MSEELKDEEIFVPEMSEDDWTAKPLTLRNTVLLTRLLAEVMAKAVMRAGDFFEGDTITEDGVVNLLSLLEPETLRLLLAIITGLDEGTVEETFVLRKAISVIIEFWRKEGMSQVLGEVRRLAGNQEFQERHGG